ncbi:MAG: sigma-54 dependent transcriptional regulator [Candidatus Binatus sp.]|uniref:sigma-54 interaction domain-containing protein n=1 Tax=Candidatus Binatus sp. TaxID=2811406 RepID=UPI00272784A9|nr:sigma-54 dependent transcriptional regulator [Candidatus Binatus sp.]MDO8433803.1 sigma-54 dependent transcriptional regulator [Candidatus Binatus sp.]
MRTQECMANGTPTTLALNTTDSAGAIDDTSEWLSLGHLALGLERVGGMVVKSAQVRKMLETISRLSPYKATVLINGESGTGKELVARALHMRGPAPGGPFVTFNCSNLVESLAESQLFGHVKGAFTDAREESLGYFRSANGGTLFLDEIGELPLRLQPKLLRAVENHEVQPVGSSQNYKVDIRLVAATNRDLKSMVAAGQFRDDLYYRLHAAAIYVPPLRERPDAIPGLVAHFIEHHNRLFGKNIGMISRAALDALCAFPWPGNVRQLGHAIESAVLMTHNDAIDLEHLSPELHDRAARAGEGSSIDARMQNVASRPSADAGANGAEWSYSLDAVINEASKAALIRALEATNGNCHRAAELLGVSRYTVYRMLNRFGLAEARAYRGLRKTNPGMA